MAPETKRLLILVGAALLTSLSSVLPQMFAGSAIAVALGHAFSNIALVMLGVPINVTGQPTVKAVTVAVSPSELTSAPGVEQ